MDAWTQHFVGVPDAEGRHGPQLIREDVWFTRQLSFVSAKGQMTRFPLHQNGVKRAVKELTSCSSSSSSSSPLIPPLPPSLLSRWRIGPALCRWSRATAAPPPSTPPTTRCSPPPRPSTSWTSASPASSSGASELQLSRRYFDETRAASLYQTVFAVIGGLEKEHFWCSHSQRGDSVLLCVLPVMFFWSWLTLRGTTSGI